MQTTELSQQNIAAAGAAVPENTPFVMLNLLRYNKEADYGDRTEFGRCSGREAYFERYVPAFAQVAALSNNETPSNWFSSAPCSPVWWELRMNHGEM